MSPVTVEDHLDALDWLAQQTGLFDRRWIIGVRSMGPAVALRWATRHPSRVERIVTGQPPAG